MKDNIQSNLKILDSGVGDRARVRFEDGIFNQLPSRNEAEILARANALRQEIRDWQSEISRSDAERSNSEAVRCSLGCQNRKMPV